MTLRNVTDFMSRSCPHFDTCSVPKKKSYLKSVKQLAHKYCTKIVKQQKKKKLNSIDNPPPHPTPQSDTGSRAFINKAREGIIFHYFKIILPQFPDLQDKSIGKNS